jgi:hypothetical protein
MAEIVIDPATSERLLAEVDGAEGDVHRQILGLRLLRRLWDDRLADVRNPETLGGFEPAEDDPRIDARFGWPSPQQPERIEIVWPAPSPPLEPLTEHDLRISPWAYHSLLLGEWASLDTNEALRLPRCVALLMCDGIAENPAGRDLLRVTSRLQILALPTSFHSQILVCGLTEGAGMVEIEMQVLAPDGSEAGFAIKSVDCQPETPSIYLTSLDSLDVQAEGRYWFSLRVLDGELARLPVEVGTAAWFEDRGGRAYGQSWTWDSDVYFGEHS